MVLKKYFLFVGLTASILAFQLLSFHVYSSHDIARQPSSVSSTESLEHEIRQFSFYGDVRIESNIHKPVQLGRFTLASKYMKNKIISKYVPKFQFVGDVFISGPKSDPDFIMIAKEELNSELYSVILKSDKLYGGVGVANNLVVSYVDGNKLILDREYGSKEILYIGVN